MVQPLPLQLEAAVGVHITYIVAENVRSCCLYEALTRAMLGLSFSDWSSVVPKEQPGID
jgi:hypothetical protein